VIGVIAMGWSKGQPIGAAAKEHNDKHWLVLLLNGEEVAARRCHGFAVFQCH
jgi:hypothetical protein